jgi:hypothetical protein
MGNTPFGEHNPNTFKACYKKIGEHCAKNKKACGDDTSGENLPAEYVKAVEEGLDE